MNLEYQESRKYRKDLENLDSSEVRKVIAAITKMAQLSQNDRAAFIQKVHQPRILKLSGGLDSTLYAMQVTGAPNIRVIFTLDDDPLFDRVIMTLLRVVHRDKMEKAYLQIAETLYRGMMDKEHAAND